MSDAQPAKKQRRWGRWVGISLPVLLAVLLAAHAAWGWWEGKKLRDEIAQLRKNGEPVVPEDFKHDAVPEPENAAIVLREAAASLKEDWSKGLGDSDYELPLTAHELEACERLIAQNTDALKLVREARARKAADWQVDVHSPIVKASLPDADGQQSLLSVLGLGVFLAHQRGEDAEAVERLRDSLAISRAAAEMPLFSSSFLVYRAGSTAQRTWDIAPDLKIGEGGASSEAVRALIEELLDEGALRQMQRRGARWLRAENVDAAMMVRDAKLEIKDPFQRKDEPFERYMRKPISAEARLLLRHGNVLIAAIEADDWLGFQHRAAEAMQIEDEVHRNGRSYRVAKVVLPAGGVRMQFLGYRTRVGVRLAATALAIRWYAVEHGMLPKRLQDLVPKYLPAVPTDLMDPQGHALRYSPDENRPAIYSVAQDGKDEGGSDKKVRGGYVGEWGTEDVVVYLKRQDRKNLQESGKE